VGTEKRERQKANRALKQQQLEKQASRRSLTRWIMIGVGAVAGVFLLAWIASNFVGEDDPTPVPPAVTVPAGTAPADIAPADTAPADTTPAAGTEG
jgi:multidrug efflux pump subunit AcrA (membrane-fusion protein)